MRLVWKRIYPRECRHLQDVPGNDHKTSAPCFGEIHSKSSVIDGPEILVALEMKAPTSYAHTVECPGLVIGFECTVD